MRRFLALALVVATTVTFQGILSPTGARAANASLVIAALRVLEREYVDPVKPVPLLNAATSSLRKATGLGDDVLPDISPDLSETAAVGKFSDEFKQAAQGGKLSETDLAYAATRGMLDSLHDSHVFFMPSAQYKQYESELAGKPGFSGIGVFVRSLKVGDGTSFIFVEDVIPGTPAAKAGLQKFDKIVQSDGKDLKGLTSRDASELIRGPAGSTATLTVQRKDQTLTVSVVRAAIQIQPVIAQFLRPGIAYVKLFEFSKGSGDQLRSALQSLTSQGPIRSVILDLRGNGGGWRTEEGIVAGAFLPPGTLLARVIGRTHPPEETVTKGTSLLAQVPLVVLINGGTSSAAEVVAIGFRFNHRATLVGEKSAGALGGSHSFSLPEGGMAVTVEWVVGPKYEQVERVGIIPEVQVELTAADMERGDDTQLESALKVVGVTGRYWNFRVPTTVPPATP